MTTEQILRDALQTIADQCSGTPGSTSRADCMAAIASAALAVTGAAEAPTPVKYESRMRPMWRSDGGGWTEWAECTAAHYADLLKTTELHDWQHEARALYAAPPSPAPAAEAGAARSAGAALYTPESWQVRDAALEDAAASVDQQSE